MRDFRTDLAFSEDEKFEPFWDAVYRYHFGADGLAWHTRNCKDNAAQRRGVDRLLYFGNDRFLRIDEKVDTWPRRNFFLEYLSVDTTQAPGWIEKDLACDYIAYGFVNENWCDLLPWPALRRAWKMNGRLWRQTYRCREIQNDGYKTHGVTVPCEIVWQAVANALSFCLPPK